MSKITNISILVYPNIVYIRKISSMIFFFCSYESKIKLFTMEKGGNIKQSQYESKIKLFTMEKGGIIIFTTRRNFLKILKKTTSKIGSIF